ncbi:hypothetical protein AB0V67_33450, partial [Mesorhizobium ciceri]
FQGYAGRNAYGYGAGAAVTTHIASESPQRRGNDAEAINVDGIDGIEDLSGVSGVSGVKSAAPETAAPAVASAAAPAPTP